VKGDMLLGAVSSWDRAIKCGMCCGQSQDRWVRL